MPGDTMAGKIALYAATVALVILTCCLSAIVVYAAADAPETFTHTEVDLIVKGYEEQVGIMLKLGAPMVAGLAASVAFLIHALLRSHRILVAEVRSATEERAKLVAQIEALVDELHQRKCLLTDAKHRKEYTS